MYITDEDASANKCNKLMKLFKFEKKIFVRRKFKNKVVKLCGFYQQITQNEKTFG